MVSLQVPVEVPVLPVCRPNQILNGSESYNLHEVSSNLLLDY